MRDQHREGDGEGVREEYREEASDGEGMREQHKKVR